MQGTTADRLASTLFMAVLAHGVLILGVTFSAGPLEERDELSSFNVTLIVEHSESDEAPEDADFIADRSRRGSGSADPGERPTTAPAADDPFSLAGEVLGADAEPGEPRDPASPLEQLATHERSEQRIRAVPQATETPAAEPMRPATLIADPQPMAVAAEVDARVQLPEARDRELVVSPDTRESNLAPYLEAWRRRVERVGTANFPAELRGAVLDVRPVLEVAIAADGRLAEVIVARSSGNSVVDQAALRILRLAMPFEPLPDAVRAEYDALRFAYEWQFSGGPQPLPREAPEAPEAPERDD